VKIYFNLGQAYAKLGRDAEAGESYSSFLLGTEGDAALASQRKVVKDALDKLKGKFAVVPLQVVPDEARKGAVITLRDASDPSAPPRQIVGNLVVFLKPSMSARYQLDATYQDLKLAQPAPVAALQAGPIASAVLLSLVPPPPVSPIVVTVPKTNPTSNPVVTPPVKDPPVVAVEPKVVPPLVRADDKPKDPRADVPRPDPKADPKANPKANPKTDPKVTEPTVKTLMANSDNGTNATTAGGLSNTPEASQPVTQADHFPAAVAFATTAVLGAGWGVSAYLAKKQSDKISTTTATGDCLADHNQELCNDFQRKAWLANILGAGTVVAAGTGVLLLIFAPTQTADGAGGEVSLRGTF
jgi:hypothetical protein